MPGKLPKGIIRRADGVLEKKTPHFNLALIKVLVAEQGARCFTWTAMQGVQGMGLTMLEAQAVIAAVDASSCFYKAMTSLHDASLWQDVYRAPTPRGDAYVKFQIVMPAPGSTSAPKVVIQFKAK